jgi:hypothetical protein
MPRHAALPYHLYVNVNNRALGPTMPDGTTRGIWHAAYCRPGQYMQAHVLLETGAHWSGLHLHDMSVTTTFLRDVDVLQPWGGMGDHLEIMHFPYLEGLWAMGIERTPLGTTSGGYSGRHTGMVFDWSDGFSRYPQEHKPLNLIELQSGQFALMPNNNMQLRDQHFTSYLKGMEDFPHYRCGDIVRWER